MTRTEALFQLPGCRHMHSREVIKCVIANFYPASFQVGHFTHWNAPPRLQRDLPWQGTAPPMSADPYLRRVPSEPLCSPGSITPRRTCDSPSSGLIPLNSHSSGRPCLTPHFISNDVCHKEYGCIDAHDTGLGERQIELRCLQMVT